MIEKYLCACLLGDTMTDNQTFTTDAFSRSCLKQPVVWLWLQHSIGHIAPMLHLEVSNKQRLQLSYSNLRESIQTRDKVKLHLNAGGGLKQLNIEQNTDFYRQMGAQH